MSDHSAIQGIVKLYEIDCNPMFANAGCTSTATADLRKSRSKPRKIPGVSASPRRGYIVSDRALVGGNLIARDMLGHLRYWLEPDGTGKPRSTRLIDGHYWEVCSLSFWQKQLGCSRQEARTGVEKLLASGAVVCEMRSFGNWNTEHFRLVLEVTQIKLREVAEQGKCVASNTDCVSSNIATSLKLHPEVPKTKNQNIKDTNEQPFVKTATPADCNKTGKADEKTPQVKTHPLTLKGVPPTPGSAPPPSPAPQKTAPGQFGEKYLTMPSKEAMQEWERLEVEYNTAVEIEGAKAEAKGEKLWGKPCVLPGWPKSKLQALQRFEYEVTKAGHDPLVILTWLTTFRWWKTSAAVGDYGIYDALPNPLYLKAHWKGFLAAYIASEFVPTIKASSQQAFKRTKGGIKGMHYAVLAAITKAGKPPAVPDVPATLEEIEKAEAEWAAEHGTEPVTLEADLVVTNTATASLATGSPLPAVVPATLPAKKPAPQKSKPLPTSKLDELKKHKLEREAAAKLAAEVGRKRMADATFSGSWLTQ